jgi:hypothetical protein
MLDYPGLGEERLVCPARGRLIINRLPRPTPLSAHIRPPCRSRALAMDRPNPIPVPPRHVILDLVELLEDTLKLLLLECRSRCLPQ